MRKESKLLFFPGDWGEFENKDKHRENVKIFRENGKGENCVK